MLGKKAFQFKGVANRKEYWLFVLANIIVTIIINLIIGIFNFLGIGLLSQIIGTIFPVFVIGSLTVNISISVRRLRDLGIRWGWIFIQLIPCSWIFIFYVSNESSIIRLL